MISERGWARERAGARVQARCAQGSIFRVLGIGFSTVRYCEQRAIEKIKEMTSASCTVTNVQAQELR